MIKALKLGVGSLKYAYDKKKTCAMYLFFLVIGILMLTLERRAGAGIVGGYLILCASMFPVQLLYSLSMSDMVQASPAKKGLQTSAPAAVSTCCMMVSYFIIALAKGIPARPGHVSREDICNEQLMLAVLGMIFMVYLAVAYKYFVFSCLSFVCMYFFTMSFMNAGGMDGLGIFGPGRLPVSFPLAVAAGAALIAAGGVLEYLVSLAVYKAPMSKYAQSAGLRREL